MPTYSATLDQLRAQLVQAHKAFMQNPTPPMATVMKRLAGAIKYQERRNSTQENTMPDKHTPGPWLVAQDGTIRRAATQDVIAYPTAHGFGETYANRNLIAAAPDLLAALERCLKNSELRRDSGVESGPLIEREIEAARAAISKATGAD